MVRLKREMKVSPDRRRNSRGSMDGLCDVTVWEGCLNPYWALWWHHIQQYLSTSGTARSLHGINRVGPAVVPPMLNHRRGLTIVIRMKEAIYMI